MVSTRPLTQAAVETALSSAAARRIVSICIRKPLAVKEISDSTALPLASAYRQVGKLVEGGVLIVERSAMTRDGKPYDLYRSRIRLGRIEVSADRVDIVWEANAALEDRLMNLWNQLGT